MKYILYNIFYDNLRLMSLLQKASSKCIIHTIHNPTSKCLICNRIFNPYKSQVISKKACLGKSQQNLQYFLILQIFRNLRSLLNQFLLRKYSSSLNLDGVFFSNVYALMLSKSSRTNQLPLKIVKEYLNIYYLISWKKFR